MVHLVPRGGWGVGGWGESSVGLARALEISVPYGLVDCPPVPKPEGSSGKAEPLPGSRRQTGVALLSLVSIQNRIPDHRPGRQLPGRGSLAVPSLYVVTRASEVLQEQADSSVLQTDLGVERIHRGQERRAEPLASRTRFVPPCWQLSSQAAFVPSAWMQRDAAGPRLGRLRTFPRSAVPASRLALLSGQVTP